MAPAPSRDRPAPAARGDGAARASAAKAPRAGADKRPAPRRQAARSGAAGASGSGSGSGSASYLAIVVLLVLYLIATLQWRLSTWAAVAYGALSLVCFILYAIDKSAAVNGRWRTPESTLHLLALAGGWPGAILAQQWLRHKSSKLAFRIVFWCTVALNMGAFMWLARWLHRHA
ncbi:DUF1294 domain-containing protein [Rugamonas rubra]|uniref:Uncharacterized membrane protein YsdA, DUF1294 family n=1 Tax=Rugamonas rubra TaxID=758825 RepID=A0A1I4USG0_9BURK|nr:DUF1294 domain-containing protein [Rugamonas rubra]SFM91845.1 Uncharacterized membrane protein YsdA, DUF1294 family [Rugamonas rubra]